MSELNSSPKAPVAARKPVERRHHGDMFVDEYEWLRDKDAPRGARVPRGRERLDRGAHRAPRAAGDDLRGDPARTQETDLSVPTRQGRLLVLHAAPSRASSTACTAGVAVRTARPTRRPARTAPLAGEEVLLDGNVLAEGPSSSRSAAFDVSPDGRLLAYSRRPRGRRALHAAGQGPAHRRAAARRGARTSLYGSAWSADGATLFYTPSTTPGGRPGLAAHARHAADDDVLVHARSRTSGSGSASASPAPSGFLIDIGSKITSEVLAARRRRPRRRAGRGRPAPAGRRVRRRARPATGS